MLRVTGQDLEMRSSSFRARHPGTSSDHHCTGELGKQATCKAHIGWCAQHLCGLAHTWCTDARGPDVPGALPLGGQGRWQKKGCGGGPHSCCMQRLCHSSRTGLPRASAGDARKQRGLGTGSSQGECACFQKPR